MRGPRIDELPRIVEETVLTDLGERLIVIAGQTRRSMEDVEKRWHALEEHDMFDVTGTEQVGSLMVRPTRDAREFAEALLSAGHALTDAAAGTFAELRRRREELASRIPSVVAEYEGAADALRCAEARYQSRHGSDGQMDAFAMTDDTPSGARRVLASVEESLYWLNDDIARFQQDVEDAEDDLSARLRGIAGGTRVRDYAVHPVTVSQDFWGFVETYPGAPAAASTSRSLAEQLTQVLGRSTERRIRWLATAERTDADRWLRAHPDFLQSVAFVDAGRAARLFARLAGASSTASNGEWNAGPLGNLMAVAPLAVGNLNGVPTAQRNMFNRKGLTRMLAQDDLDDETRSQLGEVQSRLRQPLDDDTLPSLLSLFLDADGSPRANLAYGDIDGAAQVTTITHGVSTDLRSLPEWFASGADLYSTLSNELDRTDHIPEMALVLVMDWDSGDLPTVWGIDRPDAGAARLSETWEGIRQLNPGAQLNAAGHSLGTTMTTQAVADHPGLVSHVWLFGSAGITPQTGEALAEQIEAGRTAVSVTHADADGIAEWGRKSWLGSRHSEDPREIAGVHVFGSDGGWVPGFGSTEGEYGEATDGHNARESAGDEVVGWGAGPDGTLYPEFERVEKTGYLDPWAESFKHLVNEMREAYDEAGTLR